MMASADCCQGPLTGDAGGLGHEQLLQPAFSRPRAQACIAGCPAHPTAPPLLPPAADAPQQQAQAPPPRAVPLQVAHYPARSGQQQPQPQLPSVLGVPAHPQQREEEGPNELPPPQQRPAERPSAMNEWDGAAGIMYAWLAFSVITLLIGLRPNLSLVAAVPGVCSTLGVSIYILPTCHPAIAASLGAAIRRMHLLAAVAFFTSAAGGFACLLYNWQLSDTWVPPPQLLTQAAVRV